jgi:GGDEF domain-containing protein
MPRVDAKIGQAVKAMVDNSDTVATVSQRADQALYAAKRAVKNRALSENDI